MVTETEKIKKTKSIQNQILQYACFKIKIMTYVDREITKFPFSQLSAVSNFCPNTKYTNKAYDEVPERSNMWYIFEKRIVQGHQK